MTKIMRDQRREGQDLAAGEVGQVLVLGVGERAEEHLLHHAEHVDGGEDDAGRGAHGLDAAEDAERARRRTCPLMTMNSPTKPLVPGTPIEAMVTITKSAA